MGRTLKRVAMEFNWPLNKRWRGFLNPYHSSTCEFCDGSGYGPKAKQLADDFFDFANTGRRWREAITQDEADALVASNRLMDLTHRYESGRGWVKIEPAQAVTAAQVNEWASRPAGIGHDAINRGILIDSRCKRLGVEIYCANCEGDGAYFETPEMERLHDEWKDYEPPSGEGFQLWETTSEGSPVSPVFGTLDELCEWAATNATTFGPSRASAAEWKERLEQDCVVAREGNTVFL